MPDIVFSVTVWSNREQRDEQSVVRMPPGITTAGPIKTQEK